MHFSLRVLYERVWDEADYVVPPAENGAFFVTTNVVITPNQTLGHCPEVSLSHASWVFIVLLCINKLWEKAYILMSANFFMMLLTQFSLMLPITTHFIFMNLCKSDLSKSYRDNHQEVFSTYFLRSSFQDPHSPKSNCVIDDPYTGRSTDCLPHRHLIKSKKKPI